MHPTGSRLRSPSRQVPVIPAHDPDQRCRSTAAKSGVWLQDDPTAKLPGLPPSFSGCAERTSRRATSHASSGEIGRPANARSADFCATMATSGYTEADVRTLREPHCAFRTVAQSVALAASRTSFAKAPQCREGTSPYATGRAEQKACETTGKGPSINN